MLIMKVGILGMFICAFMKRTIAQSQCDVEWAQSFGLEVSCIPFSNWAHQINNTQALLVVYPQTSQHIIAIVNWAYNVGKNVRMLGNTHSYPPIIVSEYDNPSTTVVIDMKRHMNRLRMASMTVTNTISLSTTRINAVIAEPGASMEKFMEFSQENGFGIMTTPIVGADASVGGVLAIGGHGAAINALNENIAGSGFSFGSDSNLILELNAVVWDRSLSKYTIKTFKRNDPDISAFLVHIGRAIITQVTLMVGKNYNMRCLSRIDIAASELFVHPSQSAGARTLARFVDQAGRVDVIWFPFVEKPWLKIWEVTNKKPYKSRAVTEPYNYQFHFTLDNPQIPGIEFGTQSMNLLKYGLTENRDWDIWGPSMDTLLYYNRTSAPLVYGGFVVVTSRANIQLVIHDLAKFWISLSNEYAARGIYPIDQYIKFRITGVDKASDTSIPGAVAPDISATSPVSSRPEFDVGVWMNTLTTTNRPYSNEFGMRFEQFAYERFTGRDGLARPEWSKNWGYTKDSPFANPTFIRQTIPRSFGINEWNHAVHVLDKYDPHQVISNKFLRALMVPYTENT